MKILKEEKKIELTEKKSKFITYALHITDPEKVKDVISYMWNKYPDARHVVYAYKIGAMEHFKDDREPAKTAGFQILNVIKNENVDNILIVTIRYFGGILLGTGGLTKMYKQGAIDVLKDNTKEYIPLYKYGFVIQYDDSKNFEKFIATLSKEDEHYIMEDTKYADDIQYIISSSFDFEKINNIWKDIFPQKDFELLS